MAYHHTQLFFDEPINVSVQKGDVIYYTSTNVLTPGGTGSTFEIANPFIRVVGDVLEIYDTSIVCVFWCDTGVPGQCEAHLPGANDFIMFSKDNAANMSSVVGYYAEVEMTNDSNEKAKLFAVSTDISESSK